MEILGDREISKDELTEIAYRIKPKQILDFCRTNKTTKSVCRSPKFWSKYINGNQYRYNKLLLVVAEEGDITLWRQLWEGAVPKGVIPEPKMLMPAFKLTVLNGHQELSDYIWQLYDKWTPLQLYEDAKRFEILLTAAVEAGDIKFAERLLKESRGVIRVPDSSKIAAHTPSYGILDKLLNTSERAQFYITSILQESIIIGNFELANDIIKYRLRDFDTRLVVSAAIRSKSSKALKFLIKIPGYETQLSNFFHLHKSIGGMIVNKRIVFYLLDKFPESAEIILLSSFTAFKPYEYIKLLEDYDICFTESKIRDIIKKMKDLGEYYMLKVFEDEAPLCPPK